MKAEIISKRINEEHPLYTEYELRILDRYFVLTSFCEESGERLLSVEEIVTQ